MNELGTIISIILSTIIVAAVITYGTYYPCEHHYYIVYAWEANDHTTTGYGSTDLTTRTPLDTLAKIREAEHKISLSNFKDFHAIILNYKELN